jgi:hypothetical protein
MRTRIKKSQAGVALLMALLALMVLSAIAVGLVYMTNTESQVNSNYRSEQVAYFAAKAGIEEARDRMMLLPGPYYFGNTPGLTPTLLPGDNNQQVLYVLNEGNKPNTIKPWWADATNPYMDDELCHDGYTLTGLPANTPSPDLHCDITQMPTSPNWYQTTTSQLPFNVSVNGGPVAPLAYKWVRVAVKLNNSVQNYPVNNSKAANALVCWNGSTEVPLPTTVASCGGANPPLTQVYLLTALAVSSTGARKLLQADVALTPSVPLPFGLYGTGTGCNTVTFTGNGNTDSFSSANGGTYANTQSNTGGNVGSNGGVSLVGNANIGGSLGILPVNGNIAPGVCPASNYSISGTNAGLVNNATNTPCSAANPPANCVQAMAAPVVFQAPPPPVPSPSNTSFTPPACEKGGGSCLVPGTYGNIAMSGQQTLILTPGVYNINSLNLSGQASIVITPLGQVVLNVAGNGVTGNVLDLSGQSVNNETFNANQFIINYGGTGSINVTGNANSSYFVLNAPQDQVKIAGNGHIFGAVVGNTITDVGNGTFSYDKNVNLAPPSNGALNLISFRHIPY